MKANNPWRPDEDAVLRQAARARLVWREAMRVAAAATGRSKAACNARARHLKLLFRAEFVHSDADKRRFSTAALPPRHCLRCGSDFVPAHRKNFLCEQCNDEITNDPSSAAHGFVEYEIGTIGGGYVQIHAGHIFV